MNKAKKRKKKEEDSVIVEKTKLQWWFETFVKITSKHLIYNLEAKRNIIEKKVW